MQQNTEFGADYYNPWHVIMRRELKVELLKTMAAMRSPFPEGSGLSFWIFGSTAMLVQQMEGFDLPFPKKKSHDLEIGLFNPKGISLTQNELETAVSEYFETIFNSLNCRWVGRSRDDSGAYKKQYVGNIFLGHTPSDADVVKAGIQTKELQFLVTPPNREVLLDFDISLSEPPALLFPKPVTCLGKNNTPIVLDDVRNTICKKLARSSIPGDFSYGRSPQHFKPRDIIDIFNAYYSRPWLINYAPDHPNSDIELMRTMFIVNCLSMGVDINKISLEAFDPIPENAKKLVRGLEPAVSALLDLNPRLMEHMVECVRDKILAVLCPELKQGKGVKLNSREEQFVQSLGGYRYVDGRHELLDPTISPSLLVSDKLRKDFPELETRISNLRSLHTIVEDITEKRAARGDF